MEKINIKKYWTIFTSKSSDALSKLSKAFMLPILLLPIAGLFLGVGATIASDAITTAGSGWNSFGVFLKMMGEVPFASLPVLFAISIAIAFTDDAGAAGLTALVAFLVFSAVSASFMRPEEVTYQYLVKITGSTDGTIYSLKEYFVGEAKIIEAIKESFKNLEDKTFSVEYLGENVVTYKIWFWTGVSSKLATNILGIGPTLSTGIFGGITVGCITAYLYNRLHTIQLPSYISVFSGVRFVPIATFFAIMPLAFLFILIWPAIGQAFNFFGEKSGDLPVGLDSLFFGLIERSLIPFGLHHVFYAPLWWSGAGGSLSDFLSPVDVEKLTTLTAEGDQTGFISVLADGKLKIQDVWDAGLHLGRFQTGKFPFMIFGLPAAAAAMFFTVPKENRKTALGVYASAGFTSFLTGITEPIEFTFLFIAPWLYYGIHVPLAGISFMLMNVLSVKIGMTFSGGFFDWIIYGIVPSFSGHKTNWWIVPIVGVVYAVIYFVLFYFLIKRFNVKVPGRENINNGDIRLYTKKDYRKSKIEQDLTGVENNNIAKNEKPYAILQALGGVENVIAVDACASRLRVSVNDSQLVQVDVLKSLGASGVMIRGANSVHVVFGGQSDVYKTEIKNILNKDKINE